MGSLLRPRSLYPSLRPPLSIFLPMACPELHLVLCCVPCYGHAKPLIIFAEHLVDAGHQVSGTKLRAKSSVTHICVHTVSFA